MVPRSAPKELSGCRSPSERLWSHHLMLFGRLFYVKNRFWMIFWAPLKSKGAPKTARKIQYGHCLAPRGGQKAPKSRFWRGLKSASIFGSFLDGFPEEKAPKMMPKGRSKSLKFRCEFGVWFLVFCEKPNVKIVFLHEQGSQQLSKIHQKSMQKRRSVKWCQKEPKASEKGAQNDQKSGYFMLKTGKKRPGGRQMST